MKMSTGIRSSTVATIASVILVLVAASGCSSGLSCDDKEVKAIALELTIEHLTSMLNQLRVPSDEIPEKLSSVELRDIMDISPADTPDDQCGCQATVVGSDGNMTLIYTVEATRDGNFYVQLQGLQ